MRRTPAIKTTTKKLMFKIPKYRNTVFIVVQFSPSQKIELINENIFELTEAVGPNG